VEAYVVGASPLLTAWIQYGSPFYPSMTFNPDVSVVDITCDFNLMTNADARSMGYLSRVCYAWISPKLTVAAIRFLTGNPGFNPVFSVGGGVSAGGGVAGLGLWFNALLLISVVLLTLSRKNIVTWLCAVIFVSSNFAPLKFIGYERYFPQIWAIIPLAVMNFVGTIDGTANGSRMKALRKIVAVALLAILAGLSGIVLSRCVRSFGGTMIVEGVRQRLISSLPQVVKVDDPYFRYTAIQRFRQAGITMVKAVDGETDTTVEEKVDDRWCWYFMENMPRRDPKSSRLVLPPQGERWSPGIKKVKQSVLTCTDFRTGERFAVYSNMNIVPSHKDLPKFLFSKGKLHAVIDNFPHVLWDNGQGGAK